MSDRVMKRQVRVQVTRGVDIIGANRQSQNLFRFNHSIASSDRNACSYDAAATFQVLEIFTQSTSKSDLERVHAAVAPNQ